MTILGVIICIILAILNTLVVSFAIDLLIELVIKIVKLKKENRSATINIFCLIQIDQKMDFVHLLSNFCFYQIIYTLFFLKCKQADWGVISHTNGWYYTICACIPEKAVIVYCQQLDNFRWTARNGKTARGGNSGESH